MCLRKPFGIKMLGQSKDLSLTAMDTTFKGNRNMPFAIDTEFKGKRDAVSRLKTAVLLTMTNIRRVHAFHKLLQQKDHNNTIGTLAMDVPPSITISVRRVLTPLAS